MSVPWRGNHRKAWGLFLVFALLGGSSYAAVLPLVAGADAPADSIATTTTGAAQAPPESVEWSVSAAAGPVIGSIKSPSSGVWPLSIGIASSTAWQLDLQRRRKDERLVAGVTLEGTYDHDASGAGQQLLGVDLFVGTDWRHRHWALEATIGAGLEAAQVVQQDVVTYLNPNVMGYAYHLSYQLGFYAQGTLAVAVPVSNAIDVSLRLAVHLTGAHDEDWFAASTIGFRYRLP
jgi:hypothetical protein